MASHASFPLPTFARAAPERIRDDPDSNRGFPTAPLTIFRSEDCYVREGSGMSLSAGGGGEHEEP